MIRLLICYMVTMISVVGGLVLFGYLDNPFMYQVPAMCGICAYGLTTWARYLRDQRAAR